MDQEFFYDFWIGENSDLSKYWTAYKEGNVYKRKFSTMNCHAIEITFEQALKDLPLYNLEPIYKTLKAYYHELKLDLLSADEYNSAGPLFIYEINRGSGIWTFLGELWYLLVLGTTLSEEKIKGQRIENMERKLRILRDYFGDSSVRPELFQAFMQADTPADMEQAMQNLFEERIIAIRISKSPIITSVEDARREMIDIRTVLKQSGQ